jgi:rifampin ADP-ribosylating transferase
MKRLKIVFVSKRSRLNKKYTMRFDPKNKIVQLCCKGMEMEGQDPGVAKELFLQAWNESEDDFEKFLSAHYVARHQSSVEEKLTWNESSLRYAMKISDSSVEQSYPSLYLNIARCHQDLGDLNSAGKNYCLAQAFAGNLPDDGYSNMIKAGIDKGIASLAENYELLHLGGDRDAICY